MSVSSTFPAGYSEAGAPDVLQLPPSPTVGDIKQQQIQREQQERIVRGGTSWGLYRGGLRSAAVSIFLFGSVIAVLFMVSQCFFLRVQQQKQLLLQQSIRRLAAEKETGGEKEDGGDGNFVEHICREEGEGIEGIQGQASKNSITYTESDRRLDLNPFDEEREMEEIEEDDDGEPPKKKKKGGETELQKEEGSFSLTPSFAIEMYAPPSPTPEAVAGGAAGGGGAAESMRQSILQYVEEILADDNGDSEAVEGDIYFSSLLYELNMMVGTPSIDEMQQQHRKLQQQQQPERKQQVLIDQFRNAAQSVVVLPAYGGNNHRGYDNRKREETGEEKEGDDVSGESGVEGGKNGVTDNSDNDGNADNDYNGHTGNSDDINYDNSDGSDAGDEGAADDDDNDDDGDNDGNNNGDNNDDDAGFDYRDTEDDNGYADSEDNDDADAAAAAAADDDIDDDTDREEGEAEGTEIETKTETETETEETSDENSKDRGEEDYDDCDDRRRKLLPDDDDGDDEDDNDVDDDDTDTADEGTSAAAFAAAAAAAVPADYDKPLEDAMVVQRQQPRRKRSSRSKGSEEQTLHFSHQEGSSYAPYQVAIIVDPPGRLPVEEEEEMRKRRRLRGRKEPHFQKQFIFTAGKPNAKGAYMVVCKEMYYQGRPSLLLYWMPFLDSAVAIGEQQLQRQQQLQQQNLGEHPFFRLPSVSPFALVRSFTRKNGTWRQRQTLAEMNAIIAIKDVLKKQQPLMSRDLRWLLENLEHLVEFSLRQEQVVVDNIRPANAVKKLGSALLMTDAMFAAAEVLGAYAKKHEWWQDVMATLPIYRRPTVVSAAKHSSQQSLMLLQLLQSTLDIYRGGQRPLPLLLVPLKQILLCTDAVPKLRKGNWTRFQRDDADWQRAQAQQQKVQQQQPQLLQVQHEGRQQVRQQVQQQAQQQVQQAQQQVQQAQQQVQQAQQ
ncbi:hypothetical protein EBH_0058910 [Eimeria brunetti]|uniref:Uncharacterized protein n=1 Tax=Eimeria brunetti TaxID=51314 RepID=U6LN78_9EIME|nr:hypothetical protein EBH_0058910 [Eimeria brunetti]